MKIATIHPENILNRLLVRYDEHRFVIQLKVRFIAYCYLMVILVISAAIIYTGYAHLNNPLYGYRFNFRVLGPLIGGLAVTIFCFVVLTRGYYTAAAHLLLVCGFAMVWTVMFFDRTRELSRLDTIVLVMGLLSMTPVVILKRPLGIVFYGLANIMVLYTFMFFFREDLNLPYSSFISYVSDNTFTLLAVTAISYQVYSINRRALNKAERDIAERKKAEDALKESEHKLRAIFDITFGLIGQLTVEGILLEVNNTALNLINAERNDIVDKPFWETPWWSHSVDMQEQLKAAVRDAAGGQFVRFEAIHIGADGTPFTIDFSLKPVKDNTGKVIYLIAEGRDITETREIEREMMNIVGDERRRIGQDLHDDLGQTLTGVAFLAQTLRKNIAGCPDGAEQTVVRIGDLVRKAIMKVRSLSKMLSPVEMESKGFVTAIEEMVENIQEVFLISCEVSYIGDVEVHDNNVASNLYYIAREAINNSLKHGNADEIRIVFEKKENALVMSISDNGRGIPDDRPAGGIGLKTIEYRARIIGAATKISGAEGGGTCVSITLPL